MLQELGPAEACFSKVSKPFRAHFGWYNSLCIFKTKASRGTELRSYFYSLYHIGKDQLYRTSGSEFYEWLFEPEKISVGNFEKRATGRQYHRNELNFCFAKKLWCCVAGEEKHENLVSNKMMDASWPSGYWGRRIWNLEFKSRSDHRLDLSQVVSRSIPLLYLYIPTGLSLASWDS